LDEARTVDANLPAAAGPYAQAAIPARYVVERGAWGEAAQLKPVPSKYPYTEAMTHFARALGAARSGDNAAAQKEIERITALRDELKAAKNEYWANEVEVMRLASLAWVSVAQKKGNEALGLMRQAADIEDKSEKNIVTPGRLLPARELLGDMLLELKRPADALKEYEASQHREPNRYRGLYGAAQAAAQSGNRDKARDYFSKLIELAGSGDLRPEMEKARRYLASN
jgi:tetratricopeptide (TPR) repeat protein